ncbi:hypothetical protein QJS04_geneDACA004032 [Acorus gramineus]|uniref:Transcriptional coactivator Hfi1/Transcriptional adapter 1 n=1 Tax=Acorus gramineus TaxID=55184 RepID=A0AAV9BLC4_ACOGR|nr:hypothetical protein QJS04_geneDACA004032 [Acorus gramineus]
MPSPPLKQQRINLVELKAQIVGKLGPERSGRYFSFLNRFLAQKLSKAEFDKLCFSTLGHENISLHNQLIRAILKNACHAKAPPPSTHDRTVRKDGLQQPALNQVPSIWSNGDLPKSPRKVRSVIRDRRPRDCLSPVEPNGKTVAMDHLSDRPAMENGALYPHHPCDLQRPVQHLHDGPAAEHAEDEALLKKLWIRRSPHDRTEDVVVQDEVGLARSPLRAPLGIPLRPASVGAARRSLSTGAVFGSGFSSCYDSGDLFDTEALRKRMEKIARAEGLEGVSLDCANLLNNGLDVYLKKLMRSCFELVSVRSSQETIKQSMQKQKVVNGVWPGNHVHLQSSVGPLEGMQQLRSQSPVSFLDFKVAMELNPQQLGKDWPLLLEKICLHSFEE